MNELPLLLGESPSRSGDRFWRFPLSGAPARTMCRMAGWEPDGPESELGSWTWALYARFETRNLFPRWADAERWSAPGARERWTEIYAEGPWPAVVLLGRRVAAAVCDGPPYHEWVVHQSLPMVVIPHPSGLNRLLNDPDERERCGATLRAAADPSMLSVRGDEVRAGGAQS